LVFAHGMSAHVQAPSGPHCAYTAFVVSSPQGYVHVVVPAHAVPALGGVTGHPGPGLRGVSHAHPAPPPMHAHSTPPEYAHTCIGSEHATVTSGITGGHTAGAAAGGHAPSCVAHLPSAQVARPRHSPRAAVP
jgi:hypothetical protein